jgi:pyruvate dehydrogenase E1 component
MVPFFTFYSMFGFQRVGDLIWAAADARSRGFLMGATAGRTTLLGEGLQHQDGHSQLLASTVPSVRSYDPAFAYETALIVRDGLHRMYPDSDASRGEDLIYYLSLYNENYPMPPMPEGVGPGVLAGLYRYAEAPVVGGPAATILFSGTSWVAAAEAQRELAEHYGVGAELWSATSYQQLRSQALEAERWNRLHPTEAPRTPWVTEQLVGAQGPVVAVSDWMRSVPEQIARWVPRRFMPLGTDGFGRSDTREALRRFFETDAPSVVLTVLSELVAEGALVPAALTDAIGRYQIVTEEPAPWLR